LSPEIWAALVGANFWCVIGDPLNRYNGCRLPSVLTFLTFHSFTIHFSKNCWFLDIYIQGT